MNDQINEVIEFMQELEEESGVPRNVKAKFQEIITGLKTMTAENLSLTINKLLSDLDEVANDANLDQFTRQQVWSISSMLESIDAV